MLLVHAMRLRAGWILGRRPEIQQVQQKHDLEPVARPIVFGCLDDPTGVVTWFHCNSSHDPLKPLPEMYVTFI